MKKFIYILFSLLLLANTACNDSFLETNPTDQLSDETFWQDESDAMNALYGVYGRIVSESDFLYYQVLGCDAWSDDAVNVWKGSDYNQLGSGENTVGGWYTYNQWQIQYRLIRSTNVFLANINRPVMSESVREELTAEVRFLRAYYYHILVFNFGDVPLITVPLGLEDLKIGRTPKSEVVKFIVDELTAVAETASLPEKRTSGEDGRVTKASALALKARVLLYDGQWEAAAQAASEVMQMSGYSLFTNYEDLFEIENKHNSEVLFAWQYYSDKLSNYLQIFHHMPSWGGWGGLCPLQPIVDAFECTDGKTIDKSPLYNQNNPFENRDPRLNMAIIRDGSNYRGDIINCVDYPNGPNTSGNSSPTGYYVRKFLDNEYEKGAPKVWDSNIIILRLGEVLLTYAEAQIEANKIDNTVLNAINRVRARAYGVDVSNTAAYPAITTTNQTELREIVRRERRVELCFEGLRIFDIRRWKTAETVMNGMTYGAKINGSHISVFNRIFESPKNYLWPIPQEERDLIGADILSQNSGW